MTGVLNLSDSRTCLTAAKAQHDELMSVFAGWTDSGGLGLRCIRHPEFALYRWDVVVTAEPPKNLAHMVGEVINNLRSALEYVAFQIYLVAGGEPDGKVAERVAFPILNTDGSWDSVVKKKVPGVWPEAAELLKAAQPFSQSGQDSDALPTLRGLGGTHKHRNLVLCATAAYSASAVWPSFVGVGLDIWVDRAPGDDTTKGPVIAIQPGTSVQVARVFAYPEGVPFDDAVMRWASGIDFKEPPPPDVDFSFRANNGAEVSLSAVVDLIDAVDGIVESFADLPGPDTVSPPPQSASTG